jgi:cytochrome c6
MKVASIFVGAALLSGAAAANDSKLGKQLFTTAAPPCAVCHTLQDAGAAGQVGPSLDDLKPDAARVVKALKNGIGQMPPYAGRLTDAQMAAIAAYVVQATQGK